MVISRTVRPGAAKLEQAPAGSRSGGPGLEWFIQQHAWVGGQVRDAHPTLHAAGGSRGNLEEGVCEPTTSKMTAFTDFPGFILKTHPEATLSAALSQGYKLYSENFPGQAWTTDHVPIQDPTAAGLIKTGNQAQDRLCRTGASRRAVKSPDCIRLIPPDGCAVTFPVLTDLWTSNSIHYTAQRQLGDNSRALVDRKANQPQHDQFSEDLVVELWATGCV